MARRIENRDISIRVGRQFDGPIAMGLNGHFRDGDDGLLQRRNPDFLEEGALLRCRVARQVGLCRRPRALRRGVTPFPDSDDRTPAGLYDALIGGFHLRIEEEQRMPGFMSAARSPAIVHLTSSRDLLDILFLDVVIDETKNEVHSLKCRLHPCDSGHAHRGRSPSLRNRVVRHSNRVDAGIGAATGSVRRRRAGRRRAEKSAAALRYTARAAWIARHTFSDVTGISMWRMPYSDSASMMAFGTATIAPAQPASPHPLMPSGLVVAGTG
jgi:hypothetical protein